MPSRNNLDFQSSKPYHVISRSHDGLNILKDVPDCNRFVFQLYAANIGRPAYNMHRADMDDLGRRVLEGDEIPERYVIVEHEPLVDVFSFVLANDHYHLGLVPRTKEGASQYMQKLNIGFSKYYNMKNSRKGQLFGSRFEAARVKHPLQLKELVHYLNIRKPFDVHDLGDSSDEEQLLQVLHGYQYSSFHDLYRGRYSHILSDKARRTLMEVLGDEHPFSAKGYLEVLQDHLDGRPLFWEKEMMYAKCRR